MHHAKKGAGKTRDGQALRGSSEFHAWGDSNLYLRRRGERLLLAVEHRAAESMSGIPIALSGSADSLALHVTDPQPDTDAVEVMRSPTAMERVVEALSAAEAGRPVGLTRLREQCRMRTQSLAEALAALVRDGSVEKTPAGYLLRSTPSTKSRGDQEHV